MKDLVLITDVGSVDPDDILTLILLSTIDNNFNIRGVITTHHYPYLRAKLTKLVLSELGKSDIKVYSGHGVKWCDTFDQGTRDQFLSENELWPKFFGLPNGVKKDDEKQWFPDFMKGYQEIYGRDHIDSQPIEKESGIEFLKKELLQHSPDNKLLVVCIAPPHDLSFIPTELYQSMELWMMGGGFEDINKLPTMEGGPLPVPRAGYNWGICPRITKVVCEKLTQTNTHVNLISSQIVRRKNVIVPIEYYDKWDKLSKNSSKITLAIMLDWFYCNKGNKLTAHKNMCDPLTFYMALLGKGTSKFMSFSTDIVNINDFENYLKPKTEGIELIKMYRQTGGNTRLLVDFDESIPFAILKRIENALFPYCVDVLTTKINDARQEFLKNPEQIVQLGDDIFYGVHQENQLNIDIDKLKERLFKTNSLDSGPVIVQIIGDCARFTQKGTKFVKKFIMDHINHRKILIEWGFTGYDNVDQEAYDINYVVSAIIDEWDWLPSIANIVDKHTISAIKEWGCAFSRTNGQFLLVYNNEQTVCFGDDIAISDRLCDEIICAAGGYQSFGQIVNGLLLDKPIYCITGLREDKNIIYFETSGFIDYLKSSKLVANSDVQNCMDTYMKEKYFSNPEKPDYRTKQKLWLDAWKQFIDNELWKKLDLCTVVHAH